MTPQQKQYLKCEDVFAGPLPILIQILFAVSFAVRNWLLAIVLYIFGAPWALHLHLQKNCPSYFPKKLPAQIRYCCLLHLLTNTVF